MAESVTKQTETYPILYNYESGYKTCTVQLAAKIAGLPLALKKMWEGPWTRNYIQMDPDNPMFIPPPITLSVGDEQHAYQVSSSLRCLARMKPESNLYGTTEYHKVQIDDFVDIAIANVEPTLLRILRNGGTKKPYASDKEREEDIESLVERIQLVDWEFHYKREVTPFIIGDTMTLVDVMIGGLMVAGHRLFFGKDAPAIFEKKIKNLLTWFRNFVKRPEVVEIFGTFEVGVDEKNWLDDQSDIRKMYEEAKKIKEASNEKNAESKE
eukprot:TRINITY_DN2718_c0_g1_i3.p1 TRINITY_DN2718_c0_g1~~TRINITY_DN2718_c0_g1_i3.p1  ORF type:complete len:268 (+),score=73.76 TRINITY_DN2718_c0_g1_i3:142-945(+)